MSFEVVRWPRPGSLAAVSLGVGDVLFNGTGDGIEDIAHEQQHAG